MTEVEEWQRGNRSLTSVMLPGSAQPLGLPKPAMLPALSISAIRTTSPKVGRVHHLVVPDVDRHVPGAIAVVVAHSLARVDARP